MKKSRHIWIASSMITVGLLGVTMSRTFDRSGPGVWSVNNGYWGMMGGYFQNGSGGPGMMGQWGRGNVETLTSANAIQRMKSSLQHAEVDKANNSITYQGTFIRIVVLGGAMGDSNMGPAEKFVVGGLVNPTLHVPQGSRVTLELINEDMDMPHGVEVSAAEPPYGTMPMMQGAIYPGSFIPPIAEADQNSFPAATTTFAANRAGTFYYLCEYPGHAAKGMYGKIVIA